MQGGGTSGQEPIPHLMELWPYVTLINIAKNGPYVERMDYTIMKS